MARRKGTPEEAQARREATEAEADRNAEEAREELAQDFAAHGENPGIGAVAHDRSVADTHNERYGFDG